MDLKSGTRAVKVKTRDCSLASDLLLVKALTLTLTLTLSGLLRNFKDLMNLTLCMIRLSQESRNIHT